MSEPLVFHYEVDGSDFTSAGTASVAVKKSLRQLGLPSEVIRKLSIAMAVIGEPKVIFLDEPTLGLDVLARRELWKAVEKLKKNSTIILTTHYMEEAEALADRIGIMIKGRLVKLGTLEELENATGKKGLEEVFVAVAEGEEI